MCQTLCWPLWETANVKAWGRKTDGQSQEPAIRLIWYKMHLERQSGARWGRTENTRSEEFNFYPRGNREPLKTFEQGSNMVKPGP